MQFGAFWYILAAGSTNWR